MKIESYPCTKNFQSNNCRAQLGTGKIAGPKQTYLCHTESLLDEMKGDPFWKHCSSHKRIGPKA